MKGSLKLLTIALSLFSIFTTNTHATVITFDDAISGATTYQFDSDLDGIKDVIFSTTDPSGFNTVGPGLNMTYIQEPGLEGSTLINPDLRVDFLNKAKDYLKFGFALDDFTETLNTWVAFKVYDESNNLIASDFQLGKYTNPGGMSPSSFPEGVISVTFSGTARYALFDFNNDASGGQRYIIDNFEGTYGSTEVPPAVPLPAAIWLLAPGLLGLAAIRRRFIK